MRLIDTHSHFLRSDALVNRCPGESLPSGYVFSAGIHPWHSADADFACLEQMLKMPCVRAVGEAGLDSMRGPSSDVQTAVFRRQIELSESFEKPLLIHCVRSFQPLLALRRELRPRQPWIIHGFRGKPQMARQLTSAGLYLSVGPKFNADALKEIPADRLLIETDDSETGIEAVAAAVAENLGCPAALVIDSCCGNLNRLLFP